MQLGKAMGTLVPAVIHHTLRGVPLLWVQPLDKHGEPRGCPLVCADATRMVATGETVYYVASREAALTLDPPGPVDHAVVGIVDTRTLDEPDADTSAFTVKRGGKRSTGGGKRS